MRCLSIFVYSKARPSVPLDYGIACCTCLVFGLVFDKYTTFRQANLSGVLLSVEGYSFSLSVRDAHTQTLPRVVSPELSFTLLTYSPGAMFNS